MNFSRMAFAMLGAALTVCSLSSCDEDTVVDRTGASRIVPVVRVDATVFASDGAVDGSIISPPDPAALSLTLSAEDGRYDHTWSSVTDYPVDEVLRSGSYVVSAQSGSEMTEGFDSPYFYGESRVMLESGVTQDVEITATLAQAVMDVEIPQDLKSRYAQVGLYFHSEGYSYVYYDEAETRQAFIHPGDITVSLKVVGEDAAENATVDLGIIRSARARHLYKVSLRMTDEDEPTVTLEVDGHENGSVTLTRELLLSEPPVVSPLGYSEGTDVELSEGVTPSGALGFALGGAKSTSVVLSTQAPSLAALGWPSQIDLASAQDPDLRNLEQMGLVIDRDASGSITRVDLSNVLANLRFTASDARPCFIIRCGSATGKLSDPLELGISLQPVDISVLSTSNVIIGLDKAEIVLLCHSDDLEKNIAIEALDERGQWADCEIDNLERRPSPDEWAVRFTTPGGSYSELPVRVKYCGTVLSEFSLRRVSPDFSIEADAFALSAKLRISSSDPSLVPLITSMVHVYIDGTSTVVADRRPESGVVFIGTLEPNSTYTLTATLIDNPDADDFTAPIEIHTENTLQVPNSTFDDHHRSFKYANLPSGGRYSQSIADIFNMQNYTNFDVDVPRKWADTNSKTFCKSAIQPNTWYMAPSVISELDNIADNAAVKLQSVAWDLNGEAIPNYRQQNGEFLTYNPNIPHISHRAAGKLFLGSYAFDPVTLTETYNEGIEFGSRPVAVNGNYHFTPSANGLDDSGLLLVEVLGTVNGKETVIASSRTELLPAMTFTAFSAPLSYDLFGVKATKLKIMLCSSRHAGSIEYESAHVMTYPDPRSATSIGGTLWVQDLSLSYN